MRVDHTCNIHLTLYVYERDFAHRHTKKWKISLRYINVYNAIYNYLLITV